MVRKGECYLLTIQRANLEDVVRITEIKKFAYNDETRRFGPGRDGGPAGYDSLEETKKLISTFDFFKVLLDSEIIGCFWIHKIGDQNYELEDFCIDPNYHNKGYGKETMLLMERQHPEIKKWSLGTPYYSVRNQYLYEKIGYIKIGESEDGFLYFYEKLVD